MLVKDFMTPIVYKISEDQSILEARELMLTKNLLSLPVTDDLMRLRGIITMTDIGKASPSAGSTLSKYEANYLLGRLLVKDIMSRNVITVNADDSIEYICYQVYKTRMNAFPVVDANNKVCGIIAQSDMLRAFVKAFGLHHPCTRITVTVKDEVGVLAAVAQIYKDNGVNILSLYTRVDSETGYSEIVVRANLDNHMDVIEQIREAGYNVTDVMTIRGMS